MAKPTDKNSIYYVDPKKMLTEYIKYATLRDDAKEAGLISPRIPEYLGECILKICQKLSNASNFSSYPFKEEMIDDAIENCFHGSTKILTIEHGSIEISKIVNTTVTVKSRDGVWRKAAVKSYGIQPLYEYGFGAFNIRRNDIHQKVIATKNHRWFITSRRDNRGLVKYNNETITDLKIGDALERVPYLDGLDCKAVLHGIIFGDGTGHKSQVFNETPIVQQGTKYAFIRVCKQDAVKDIIINVLENAGYEAKYPEHANGDPIFYIGKQLLIKDVPFTTDPSYIAGFIYGWWLADGNKTTYSNRMQITTSNENAVNWLINYAAFGGYEITGVNKKFRTENDGSFKNGKPLYIIHMARHDLMYEPKCRSIEYYGEEEVYCVEEPVTHGFVLANGLLTGNCIKYFDKFDPNHIASRSKKVNIFAYYTQIAWFAFLRRIASEKKELYAKHKLLENSVLFHDLISQDCDTDDYAKDVKTQLTSDFMNNFVEEYEATMEENKNKQKRKVKDGPEDS